MDIKGCVFDMSVGNFDHVQPDPSNPGHTVHDPRQQIAIVTADQGADGSCTE